MFEICLYKILNIFFVLKKLKSITFWTGVGLGKSKPTRHSFIGSIDDYKSE